MKAINLFGKDSIVEVERERCVSDKMKNLFKEKSNDSLCAMVVISDYVGTLADRCAIEYFEKNYPDNIIVEDASYSGRVALIFGDIDENVEDIFDIESFEQYYYEAESKQVDEEIVQFCEWYKLDKEEVESAIREWIENNGHQYLANTLDYSEKCLVNYLKGVNNYRLVS